jgi:hypothetical protein
MAEPAEQDDHDPPSTGVPWRVYEVLARVALRHVEAELAAGRGDRAQLKADREVLERVLFKPPAQTAA